MINFLKEKEKEKTKTQNTVSVIDNHLVLSLTETDSPTIWRMSLDDIGTSVFSIKKNKDKSNLILKPKGGKEDVIASFDNEKEATEILSLISSNLLQPAKSKPVKNSKISGANKEANDNTEQKKWGVALLLVFMIIGLYIYLTTLMPENISAIDQTTLTGSENNGPNSTTGQPVSADDFLKGLE